MKPNAASRLPFFAASDSPLRALLPAVAQPSTTAVDVSLVEKIAALVKQLTGDSLNGIKVRQASRQLLNFALGIFIFAPFSSMVVALETAEIVVM